MGILSAAKCVGDIVMDEDIGFGGMPPPDKEREAKVLKAGAKLTKKRKIEIERAMKRRERAARYSMCHCESCGRYMRPIVRENHEKRYPGSPFLTCYTCIFS